MNLLPDDTKPEYSAHDLIEHTETVLSHYLLDMDMTGRHTDRNTDSDVAKEYRQSRKSLYKLVEALTDYLRKHTESETV